MGESEGRAAQENAWKCIPRSEGVPVAKPKDREKRARKGGGGRDRGRDWDAEDIIRVEKPTPRTVTEKLCLILPADPAPAIVILHFAGLRSFPVSSGPSEGFAYTPTESTIERGEWRSSTLLKLCWLRSLLEGGNGTYIYLGRV